MIPTRSTSEGPPLAVDAVSRDRRPADAGCSGKSRADALLALAGGVGDSFSCRSRRWSRSAASLAGGRPTPLSRSELRSSSTRVSQPFSRAPNAKAVRCRASAASDEDRAHSPASRWSPSGFVGCVVRSDGDLDWFAGGASPLLFGEGSPISNTGREVEQCFVVWKSACRGSRNAHRVSCRPDASLEPVSSAFSIQSCCGRERSLSFWTIEHDRIDPHARTVSRPSSRQSCRGHAYGGAGPLLVLILSCGGLERGSSTNASARAMRRSSGWATSRRCTPRVSSRPVSFPSSRRSSVWRA